MARIKSTEMSSEFSAMLKDAKDAGDDKFCAPIAIAIVTGRPFAEVHAVLEELGRDNASSTPRGLTWQALKHFGAKVEKLSYLERMSIIQEYPGVHKNLKSLTTHHPVRFNKVWKEIGIDNALLFSKEHVSAYKDGEVHDWAKGRAIRVVDVWVVTMPNEPTITLDWGDAPAIDGPDTTAHGIEDAEPGYGQMTVAQLRKVASERKIKGYGKMSKSDLLAAIKE